MSGSDEIYEAYKAARRYVFAYRLLDKIKFETAPFEETYPVAKRIEAAHKALVACFPPKSFITTAASSPDYDEDLI